MLFSCMLYMLVGYASPKGPIYVLDVPAVVLLFFICFIAAWTCVVVSVILVVSSLCAFLSMCLFVLKMTVLVNCLLKVIVLFSCCFRVG